MVGVKVLGPVKNGERIFASLEHPGVAVPQSRVIDALSSDAFLLGQTLERLDAKENEVNLAQSFVSILLSISSSHMTDAVSDLREHMREDLKTEVKEFKKNCLRGTCENKYLIFSSKTLHTVHTGLLAHQAGASPGGFLSITGSAVKRNGEGRHSQLLVSHSFFGIVLQRNVTRNLVSRQSLAAKLISPINYFRFSPLVVCGLHPRSTIRSSVISVIRPRHRAPLLQMPPGIY